MEKSDQHILQNLSFCVPQKKVQPVFTFNFLGLMKFPMYFEHINAIELENAVL